MTRFTVLAALAFAPTLALSPALALTVTEPPDFPNDSASAPAYALDLGNNQVSGALIAGGNDADHFKITVLPGRKLTLVQTSGAASNSVPVPLYAGTYALSVAGQPQPGSEAWSFTFVVAVAEDYSVTTAGGPIVVTDRAGNGDTLTVSAPAAGQLQFGTPGRTFSVDGGLYLAGSSGGLSYAGTQSVAVQTGAGVLPAAPRTVSVQAPLVFAIASDTPGSYPQLDVTGRVELAGASLSLAGTTFPGTEGQTFTIVKNDGTDAIVGAFAGLPQGATLAWPGSPLLHARIGYTGGDGNDVVLTLVSALKVTHTGDAGPGSLRDAVTVAAGRPGPDTITFDASLSGATIRLQSQILSQDHGGVTIDGSALARAVTIDGDSNGNGVADDTRLFFHSSLSGTGLHLIGLRLIRGYAQVGGAILCDGQLTLTRCTFSDNVATLRGGAVDSEYRCEAIQCTFTGNSAPSLGGAIYNAEFATMRLRQCTLAGNSAATGADVYNYESLFLDGCIVASLASIGTVTGSANLVNTPPGLAPLGDYGGPIPTMALLPDSPARNAATGSTATSDQRGFPIVGVPDIGAYEAGTLRSYAAWNWETLPATTTPVQRAPDADLDGDQRTNFLEYATLTDPAVQTTDALPRVTRTSGAPVSVEFSVRAGALDLIYELERSQPGVGPWAVIAQVNPASNTITSDPGVTPTVNLPTVRFSDATVSGKKMVFYRLRVRLP
jgi:predicted outer membrane repeat protein